MTDLQVETPFKAAASAAVSILTEAHDIVSRYRDENAWIKNGTLIIPSLKFGNFLRDVITTERLVNAVARQIVDAKRDDQLIRFGDCCERTAHQVAVVFARFVGGAIFSSLWTREGDGTPYGTAFDQWPIDGLASDRHFQEFREHWRDICLAFQSVNMGRIAEIRPLIHLESQRAESHLEAIKAVPSRFGNKTSVAGGKRTEKKARKRRAKNANADQLTPRQVEVLKVHSECNSNSVEAAKRLNIKPATVRQIMKTVNVKLGKMLKKPKTSRIRKDGRGNIDVTRDDDRRLDSI